MRKRLIPALLACALAMTAALPAYADEEPPVAVEVTVNVELTWYTSVLLGGTSYVPFYRPVTTLRPDAEVTWEDGVFTAAAGDFTMTCRIGDPCIVINDRYLYIPGGVRGWADGTALIPARTLALALGAWVDWTGRVELCSGGVPLTAEGKPYDDETLDLVARVITHESGNQPLEGKMAVGDVIMNRVNSPSFGRTVYEVLFAPHQFPGATTATPNEESPLAAKLVPEGANVVPEALSFHRAGKPCWASRNKRLLYTIGGHAFYG